MKQDKTPQIIEVKVNKKQTLSDVKQIYPLPSDGIFHKRIPGLGATHGEINSSRHSIIVLPNRPVIEGKVAKHNSEHPHAKKILGIYKGINQAIIEEYLTDETITFKKILTTPEGYKDKFKLVVTDVFEHIKKTYYMLIDECERSIQDVKYRNKITAPFDDFFDFTKKGLISATVLPFSDPRFEGFTHYLIVPTYKYRKRLNLITTNNVVLSFNKYISTVAEGPLFIFSSSITAMTALIEAADIKGKSIIHCSERSITSLRMRGFKVDHRLNVKELRKYNFFTSRFYSAVDIELAYKADILMITEVVFAEHSILDPQTEVVQIAGRFRNGTQRITHISNFNPDLEIKTPEEIKVYFDGQQAVYKEILSLKRKLTDTGAQAAIDEILEHSKFAKYFQPDGSFNWFMFDNAIQEARVLAFYKTKESLLSAYSKVKDHFTVSHKNNKYPLTDSDRLKRQSAQSRKEEIKEVVEELTRLQTRVDNFVLMGEQSWNELVDEYPDIIEAFRLIGREGIINAGYNERAIKRLVSEIKRDKLFFSEAVLKAVDEKFKPHTEFGELYITTTLQDIYDRNGIVAKAFATHILKYFEGDRTTRGAGDNKVYALREKKTHN